MIENYASLQVHQRLSERGIKSRRRIEIVGFDHKSLHADPRICDPKEDGSGELLTVPLKYIIKSKIRLLLNR